MKKIPVGVGIIGSGFARTTQIPGFKACAGARVVAIASRQRERAELVAREFDIPNVANNWRELVQRDDVELVSVVTPPATHKEIVLAALAHGKAVLCEKPMAMTALESQEMVEKASKAGVLALLDHELRFLKGRQTMRNMLRSGAIGQVRHCNYLFRSDYRGKTDRAWDWWSDRKMGGGTLGAIGSHVIDSFRWMLGTEISSVLGLLSTHIKQRPDKEGGQESRAVTTDDEAKLLFRFADGPLTNETTGAASLSVVESGKHDNRLEIYGSSGALMVEETGELWHSPFGSGAWRRVELELDQMAPGMRESSWSRGFTTYSRRIIDALQSGRTELPDAANFEDGHRVQQAIDAARTSNETGCWANLAL